MKKFLKILGIVLLILIVVLATAPVLFKGKIIKLANEQLSSNLNAKASFSDLNISLFRNFPNLAIRLKNLCVVGNDPFAKDTLLSVRSFDLAVNIISAVKMENIKVKKIIINQPHINAIVLADGTANWDIFPEGDTTVQEPVDTTTSSFAGKISLKLFRINQAIINYTDLKSDIKASLDKFDFTLSGDFSQDFSKLLIDSETDKVNLTMDGIRYLKDVLMKMHVGVDANLKDAIYKLNENSFSLNDLTLSWNGSLEMPESGDIITNLDFKTSNTDFKTLLSLVPAIYLNDFSDLKTTGSLKLEGKVIGAVNETTTPDVDAKLLVNNATFSYPDLPKSAKNIQLDVNIHYDGKQADNTTVDINKFHVDLGDNPVDLTMNLKTPMSDPFTNGKLMAVIDLQTLTDVIPLEDTEIKGRIDAKLDWMGKMSSIETEKYEDFKADGTIKINDLVYRSSDLPKTFTLKNSDIRFSPKALEIAAFEATLGSSDFSLQGNLSNYIPYVLKDKTVKGELTLRSNLIDVNEFMSDAETEEETVAVEDTSAMEVFEVPGNIDFRFVSTIGKVLFDKLDIRNLQGIIHMKDKKVKLEKLSMNTLDGSLALSGEYNTQDIKNPLVDLNINATGIDIPKSTVAFNLLGKIAPIASKASGKVNLGLTYSSFLSENMKPILSSVSGSGNLSSREIGIKSSTAFSAIGDALKTDALKNMTLKDVDLNFIIQNGSLTVQPFETSMGDVKMNIGGQQSFGKTLDYSINLSAPRKLLGLENPALNNLYKNATAKGINITPSETVNLLVKLTGELKDPKVSLDLKESASNVVSDVKETIKESAKEVIETKKEEVKEDVKKQAREEADKIMKEAEKQAASIRSEAKRAADAVRAEANANANRVVNEAKNPVTKRAAEVSAKKIRDEGEAKAKKIEQEADQKANKVLTEAKAKSDRLLQ